MQTIFEGMEKDCCDSLVKSWLIALSNGENFRLSQVFFLAEDSDEIETAFGCQFSLDEINKISFDFEGLKKALEDQAERSEVSDTLLYNYSVESRKGVIFDDFNCLDNTFDITNETLKALAIYEGV